MSEFVHLHVHSHYSLLDGLAKIDGLVDRTKSLGMEAIALTDHGNLYGAVEFYKKAKKAGIKPIIGVETYIAPNGYLNKRPKIDERRYHQILLAKNETGWKNLIRLVTASYLDGFYYKPRIDKTLLEKYHEGLVCLSGCFSGEIGRLVAAQKLDEAEEVARWYKNLFGEDYYLEVQPHTPDLHTPLQALSKKLDIPLVATQDIHYVNADDKTAHEILLAIQTNSKLDDEDRLNMKRYDISLQSPEEMAKHFAHIPEAIENTAKVAEKCNWELTLGKTLLPRFPLPDGITSTFEYLEQLAKERIQRRYPEITDAVRDRVAMELGVIEKTGFADYFLIVQDFVNWAKDHGIVVGPGRGSAAGSIISYILGITNLDPLKYDLLFERFLNPDRIQAPDIDIDFTDIRRDEVLAYVRERYGSDHVAQIITFGTMMARAAVRDAGRAMGYPYGLCDQIAKLITGLNTPLKDSIRMIPELKEMYVKNEDAKKILDAALKLEGTARHASVHACGVVISPEPLTNFMPLQRAPQGEETILTQFEMHSVEDLGLLKMDFLGLKNLTIIEKTLRLIKENKDITIDIDSIPLDDKKSFELFQNADTTGIFQLESQGMRRYLKELKPTELEDIIVMISLYRPGPMELIPQYINRKFGKETVTYIHPKLKPILEGTYGVGIYQEQMMRIARDLAGFTLAEADTLRKAIGKKIKSLLDEQQEKLIKGMVEHGIDKRTAVKIWDLFPPFARYGFNRCVTGDTTIIDPETGVPMRVRDIFEKKRMLHSVFALKNNLKISEQKIEHVFSNGKKKIWKITTRSGRTITATANHPFLTPSGWNLLKQLKVKDKIAVPRTLPEPKNPLRNIPRYKLAVLGYLLAEGNLCHPSGFYFYSKSETEIRDYCDSLERFENTAGKINTSKPAVSVYAKRRDIARPSEAVEWIKSLDLYGKTATKKFIPELVFRLSNEDVAIVIGKMFQGDGCINLKRKDPQIFYATSSSRLAHNLQHLLLRFGILSSIHHKKFKYREGIKVGYTITINRYDNIQKFADTFGAHLIGEKADTLRHILVTHPILNGILKSWSARGSYDTIPVALVFNTMREAVTAQGISFKGFERDYGLSWRLFMNDRKKIGYLRETIGALGEKLKNKELTAHASSDIYWDEVKNIEPKGIEETYDLTVAEEHNFIANNIFVHNSHAACYAMVSYETAYLKANFPVEFMTSLLNVSGTDIERINFLVNEARHLGIQVLPPDVNLSFQDFAVDGTNIRFGLLAIKNLGANIVNAIIEERAQGGSYENLQNFLSRVHHRDMNKKSLESLIKAGALDSFGIERGELLANIEDLLKFNQAAKKLSGSNQNSLFGGVATFGTLRLRPAEKIDKGTMLGWEKELLGLYLTDHPMREHLPKLNGKAKTIKFALSLPKQGDRSLKFYLAGVVSVVKKIITKKGQPMLFVTLEDSENDTIELLVFSELLGKNPEAWEENKVVLIDGYVSWKNGDTKYICEEVQVL